MYHLIKVIAVFFILNQCDNVVSKKFIKLVTIEKEHEHEIHHHSKPISFIKETITPFGKFTFRHFVEKRDLLKRKARDIEDLIKLPNVETEDESKSIIDTEEKKIVYASIPTDIILTRMEFYKGKPIESIKLHSVLMPSKSENESEKDEILEASQTETQSNIVSESEGAIKETAPEPVPLSIPEKSEPLENGNEPILEQSSDTNVVDIKPDVEEMNEAVEVKSDLEDLKLNEAHHEKEIAQTELSEAIVEKDTVEESPVVETSESGAVDNKDIEIEETHAVNENVEVVPPIEVEELTSKSTVEGSPIEKSVEVTQVPVSSIPKPVYIPLYTDIKIPEPIPAVVKVEHQAPEPEPEVHEVVSVVPSVIVITEKEAVEPPPPPPSVQTVETVIETEQTPNLFSKGSRFMLNFSSRILKKLMRLVSSARSRLHLGTADD